MNNQKIITGHIGWSPDYESTPDPKLLKRGGGSVAPSGCAGTKEQPLPGRSAPPCSACGQAPVQSGRRKADYGDFSEYEVRRLVAEYCMSVTLGCTGWGVPFKVWVELHGIAKHDGMFRLIRLPNDSMEAREK